MLGLLELGIILLVVLSFIGLITMVFFKLRNQERLKLIEKGFNPDEGRNITEQRKTESLKNGVLFIAFAIGLLMGPVLDRHVRGYDTFIAYASMILLFGGIGFLVNYFLTRDRNIRN